jgi:phage gp37-like protein
MIAAIENALVTSLGRLTAGAAGYSLRVEGYAGQLTSEDDLKTVLNGPMPRAYVSFIDSRNAGGTLTNPVMAAHFRVILICRATETAAAARHGVGDRVGTYQVMADVTGLLNGSRLGLEVVPCRVVRARAIYNGKITQQRLSVIEMEVETGWTGERRHLPGDDGDIGEFLRLHVGWTGRDEPDTGPLPDTGPATTLQEIEVRNEDD